METKEHDTLEKLFELLSQNQFELLPPFDEGRIRLVYLMNDAVESFLVFEDARITGTYQSDYEGELDAEVSVEEDDSYVLVVRQGESVCTVFFQALSLEVHLYNYGKTGHVWMKGQEDLRQIEYWIAILKTKLDYLGESCCNDKEKFLASLEEFPPLNCCCYPAVPRIYFEPREDAWTPSERGIRTMTTLAEEVQDNRMLRALRLYQHFPWKITARWIAGMLQKNTHTKLVERIIEEILEASAGYEDRSFPDAEATAFRQVRERAKARMDVLRREGKQVRMICQEPFEAARDSVEYQIHLLIAEYGVRKRKITVETFS